MNYNKVGYSNRIWFILYLIVCLTTSGIILAHTHYSEMQTEISFAFDIEAESGSEDRVEEEENKDHIASEMLLEVDLFFNHSDYTSKTYSISSHVERMFSPPPEHS